MQIKKYINSKKGEQLRNKQLNSLYVTLRKTKENIETLTKKIVWEMEPNIWIALKAELLEIEKQSFTTAEINTLIN